MLRCKSYSIPMKPVAWQRAGLKGKRFYNAQSDQTLRFGLYLKQQHNEEPLFCKPVSIDIIFYMPAPEIKIPKSIYHSNAPDIDNLEKFLLDCIKGVLISDDRIICSLAAKKLYSKETRTDFVITEVE